MNRTALIAALGTGLAGAVLLFIYVSRFEAQVSGGPKVEVLVALQDIPLGTALDDKMLGTRFIPQAYVEGRHIRAVDARQVIGIRVSMGVKANESLLWTDLATTSEQRRDLSGLVKNGLRAVTIRADVTATFGGLVRPGDRVDVLLTSSHPTSDSVTLPLLQNVLVLAVGRDTGAVAQDEASKRRVTAATSQVTLSVSPEQAQLLTLAEEKGRLTLVLRNPDDIAIIEGLPEATPADIFQATKRAVLQRRDRPAAAPPTKPEGIERVH